MEPPPAPMVVRSTKGALIGIPHSTWKSVVYESLPWRTTPTSQLKFGIDGGAGLALKIGRLYAFIEGHLQNVYTQRGLIDAKSIQAVPVSFGVLF